MKIRNFSGSTNIYRINSFFKKHFPKNKIYAYSTKQMPKRYRTSYRSKRMKKRSKRFTYFPRTGTFKFHKAISRLQKAHRTRMAFKKRKINRGIKHLNYQKQPHKFITYTQFLPDACILNPQSAAGVAPQFAGLGYIGTGDNNTLAPHYTCLEEVLQVGMFYRDPTAPNRIHVFNDRLEQDCLLYQACRIVKTKYTLIQIALGKNDPIPDAGTVPATGHIPPETNPGDRDIKFSWFSALDIGITDRSPAQIQNFKSSDYPMYNYCLAGTPPVGVPGCAMNKYFGTRNAQLKTWDSENKRNHHFTVTRQHPKSIYAQQRYNILSAGGTAVSATMQVGSWIDTDYVYQAAKNQFNANQLPDPSHADPLSDAYKSVAAITSTPPLTIYGESIPYKHAIEYEAPVAPATDTTYEIVNTQFPLYQVIVSITVEFKGRKNTGYVEPP